MKFKIPKDQLIMMMASNARFAAQDSIRSALLYQDHRDQTSTVDTISRAVSQGIELGIQKAMQEFFAQEYTDDDFEKDLNLK